MQDTSERICAAVSWVVARGRVIAAPGRGQTPVIQEYRPIPAHAGPVLQQLLDAGVSESHLQALKAHPEWARTSDRLVTNAEHTAFWEKGNGAFKPWVKAMQLAVALSFLFQATAPCSETACSTAAHEGRAGRPMGLGIVPGKRSAFVEFQRWTPSIESSASAIAGLCDAVGLLLWHMARRVPNWCPA